MKKFRVLKIFLAVVMIIELAICAFVTPGWLKKSAGGSFSYEVSGDVFDDMEITATQLVGNEAKQYYDEDRYTLLSNPVSFECEDYDGVIFGDDVLYTVEIPKDSDVDRLMFIYFDENGDTRYLTPDIIDVDNGTMSVYLPHFSLFGAAELTKEEQIEAFLDDYSMRIAIDNSEQKQAAAELEPYVRAKVEAMGLTKSATEDLIQSTVNYLGGRFKGTEEEPYKYGDTIETGTKAMTTLTRGVIDGDRDAMQTGLEDTLNGALMHCWSDLKFSDRIDEVLGSEFAGKGSETLLGNAGGVARMAGFMMEGDWEDAARELGGVMQNVAPQAELVTKGATFLASLGNMAFTNWKSNQVEELYQIYKNGASDIWGNEVYAGDRESFLTYLNTSSGFTMAKGVGRFYNLDNIDAICKQYGWDYDTYKDIPDKYRRQFEARAEEGLLEYFELRRSQEAEAEKIKKEERACIEEMLNYNYGVLESSNYKQFFGENSDKDFNMRSRLDRLVNVRRYISQYVDEDALKKLGKSGYNYGTLLNEWIRYASTYKKEEALDKFCDYLKDIGAYKKGSNDDTNNTSEGKTEEDVQYVGGDDWYVGTWSVLKSGDGNAYMISGRSDIMLYPIKIENGSMKAYSDFYQGTVAEDGSYVLIDYYPWDEEEGYTISNFIAVKMLRPTSGDGSEIEVIYAPSELCGDEALNESATWYKR